MSTPHTPKGATKEPMFDGFADRECGEHRTTGPRAWCFACSEWCYPEAPCRGCELPSLRVQVAALQAENGELTEARDRIQRLHDGIKAAYDSDGKEVVHWSKLLNMPGSTIADIVARMGIEIQSLQSVETFLNEVKAERDEALRTVGELREALDAVQRIVSNLRRVPTDCWGNPNVASRDWPTEEERSRGLARIAEILESSSPPPTVEGEGS